jgi:hypothetical protein
MPKIPTVDNIEIVGKAFISPSGQKALEVLRTLFEEPISYEPGDMFATAFNEGHRDVVKFIINATKMAEEGSKC